jgi:exopolysaccharide biosynthesis polyprenyl glycosylphosphotransferase
MHRVLAVGEADHVRELIDTVQRQPHASFAVVAACVPGAEVGHVAGVQTFSAMANIPAMAREAGVDTIAFTASRGMTSRTLRQLSWELEGTGIGIVVSPGLTDVAGPRISVRPVAGLPLLHVDEPDLGAARRVLKRGMDLALSCLLAVFLLPVLVAVALAVRLGSPGPVLFRQTRVGAGGQHFRLYKFRSMYADAESRVSDLMAFNEASGPLFKMRNDPRVTPVGRVLRRYSLDELPQLINVFKGEMSLVGPRPPLPDEASQYDEVMLRRLRVEPGVTGLWQVSGRSHLSWEDSVRLDLYYVENWSPLLDLSILARTVVAVLRPSGAY